MAMFQIHFSNIAAVSLAKDRQHLLPGQYVPYVSDQNIGGVGRH